MLLGKRQKYQSGGQLYNDTIKAWESCCTFVLLWAGIHWPINASLASILLLHPSFSYPDNIFCLQDTAWIFLHNLKYVFYRDAFIRIGMKFDKKLHFLHEKTGFYKSTFKKRRHLLIVKTVFIYSLEGRITIKVSIFRWKSETVLNRLIFHFSPLTHFLVRRCLIPQCPSTRNFLLGIILFNQ